LKENERAYILSILKKTNGRIRGADGAAEFLKIPPTTLHSKMKKLGIKKIGY
jgi:transcriptional regulator with GAF, ATPase, and Fis domain